MLTLFKSSRGLEEASKLTPLPVEYGEKPTYRFATGPIAPVAAPTDIVMIQGSATKVVRIKTIAVYGKSSSAGAISLKIERRTTQFTTQGTATFTPVTAAKHDSQDPAATAVVSYIQTANLTSVGASAGVIDNGMLTFGNGGAVPVPAIIWDFCQSADKPIILRGVNEFLFIGGVGEALPTAANIHFSIELEESDS